MPRTGAVGILSLGIVVAATGLLTHFSARIAPAHTTVSEPSEASFDVTRAVFSMGLTPKSAAASGMNAEDVEAAFTHCENRASEIADALELEESVEDAKQQLAQWRSDVRRLGLTSERLDSIQQADSALATLQSEHIYAMNSLREQFRIMLASRIGHANAEILRNFHTNSLRNVPDPYRCLDLNENHWDILEVALDKAEINEAAALNDSIGPVPLSASESEVLAIAANSSAVAIVDSRLRNSLDAMIEVFDDASDPE
jgi:hypothetical protein